MKNLDFPISANLIQYLKIIANEIHYVNGKN